MRTKYLTLIARIVMVVMVLGLLSPTVTAAKGGKGGKGGNEARARLRASRAFPGASGAAKYRDRSGDREFEVEVEHVRALANQTLSVRVSGRQVGTLRISGLGSGELNLSSERGQAVPVAGAGAAVSVWTHDGVLVVSGTMP